MGPSLSPQWAEMDMTETTELTLDDIESLAVGAWILGTGGGGSPYLGLLNMRRLYAEGHRVRLMSPYAMACPGKEFSTRIAIASIA